MRSYIFASCDEKYFMEHGYHFANSAAKQGVRPWIDIISPDPDLFLSKVKLPDAAKITFTESKETDRTFYACNRFLVTGKVLESVDEVLITDVDCFLRKPINWHDFNDCDYSLYLRESLPGTVGWEKEGTKVGAGAVYLTNKAADFMATVQSQIARYGLIWFVDQVALWQVHKHFVDNNLGLRFREMPFKYIDWEFGSDGVIWTGKGNRKIQADYLEERERAS